MNDQMNVPSRSSRPFLLAVVVILAIGGIAVYVSNRSDPAPVVAPQVIVQTPTEAFDSQVKVYEKARLDLTSDMYAKDSATREALKAQLVIQRNLKVNEVVINKMREAFRATNKPLAQDQIENIVKMAEQLTVLDYAKTYRDELVKKLDYVSSEPFEEQTNSAIPQASSDFPLPQ